jgi:hypothetical protein
MNDSGFTPVVSVFSAGYDLVENAQVQPWSQDEAAMDYEMFEKLQSRFGGGAGLIGSVGGIHYCFKPVGGIPRGAVAVPERNHDNPEALLIQK